MSDETDRQVIAGVLHALCGTCRYCQCRGDSCPLPEGEKCCWVDALRTLCSNPACLVQAGKEKNRRRWAHKRAARKTRGTAA